MDVMGLVIIFAGILFLALILILIWALSSSKTTDDEEYWVEVSEILGLTYHRKKKMLAGTYRGRGVILDQFEPLRSPAGILAFAVGTQALDNPDPMIEILHGRIRVHAEINNPFGGYLSLVKSERSSPLEKLLTHPVQTGIAAINDQFQVESKPKAFVSKVFASQGLGDRFLEFQDTSPTSLVINKNKLHLHASGLQISPTTILKVLDLACDFGDTVDALT